MELTTRTIHIDKNASVTYSIEWDLPPDRISIHPGEVHLWKAHLNPAAPRQEYANILSAEERQRAVRLIDPLNRERFCSARIVLRNILSLYKNISPEMIKFSLGKNGKPYTMQGSLNNPISFNITHSANLMLVVLSNSTPVGIDLEEEHSLSSKEWIINHYFSQRDKYFFDQLPEKARTTVFLRLWTLKEAYAKALGSGLAGAPEIDFSEDDHRGGLRTDQVIIYPKKDFYFLCFLPQKGFIASAAVLTNIRPVPRFYLYTSKFGT